MKPLTITSYNIHKGMSALNRKVQVTPMAEALKLIQPDIIFLQEVQGLHLKRTLKIEEFSPQPQHDIIADYLAHYFKSYGKNAEFKGKHHGNAILSHIPIQTKLNIDISTNQFEQRGILHCELTPPDWDTPIICLCAHLNLMQQDRIKQYQTIFNYIENNIDPSFPIILAGDFNDWNRNAFSYLSQLNLREAFLSLHGISPKTFPSKLPLLSLDRIFTRNLKIVTATAHKNKPWSNLSDHLPISIEIEPLK